jgi:chromosome segregation ATPase
MDTILAALRTALVSYRAELQTLLAEEDNVAAYLNRLRHRKAKLTADITEIEAKLEDAGKGATSAGPDPGE